jgi:DNA topoisomerase-1
MNKILVIVESPAKCKKIESFLGPEYKCLASYGHLRELNSLNQIDVNYIPNYSIIEKKKNQIEKLRTEIENAKEIILATDDDREGESIAWHICMIFNLPIKTIKRIIFHEITETALQNAVLNPKQINMNLVNAQQGRQILDLLVGFTITPILWNYISKNHGLSAGRCQTPALKILYDNYIEIQNEKSKQMYNTIGYFTNKNIAFELSKEYETEEEITFFLENSLNFNHIYNVSIPKKTEISGPEPFITSTLQQVSSNELHLSPKDTMKYAQQLYENGLITYMRTDSKTYSKDFISQTKKYIEQEYNDIKYIKHNIEDLSENRIVDGKHEAHEAIRTVSIKIKSADITESIEPKAKRLYELIWKRTLESCMSDAIIYVINAEISAFQNIFKHKSEQIIFPGWKIVKKYDENQIYNYLLALKQETILEYNKIIVTIKINTKSHYTEAKLVHLLEEKGIGRPSTFSTLIDKIQERGYAEKKNIKGKIIQCKEFLLEGEELTEQNVEREFGNEKNKLIITPLGITVIEFLINHFENIFSFDYTNRMEKELDIISQGQKTYPELCQKCFEEMNELIKPIQQEKYEIQIDENHSYIIGKYGPVIKKRIGKNISFLPIKKDIDLTKLERGEYLLKDLLDSTEKNEPIGKYQGEDLFLHKGKYGNYVQWGENKKSLQELGNKPYEKITFTEIFKILEKDGIMDTNKPAGFVRQVSPNISIRNGKFGDYIFYKNSKMKTPQFFKLFGFKGDYIKGDIVFLLTWIKQKYNIE